MSVLEIVLLAAGAVLFTVSYMIPVKKEKIHEDAKKLAEDEVRDLVRNEIEQAKVLVEEMAKEACQDEIDKTERSMERLSNEKIMAVSEYSDTVLDEIHKNHQEVVFLYDMLNEKQDTIKETVETTEQNMKDLLQEIKDSELTIRDDLHERRKAITEASILGDVAAAEADPQEDKAPIEPADLVLSGEHTTGLSNGDGSVQYAQDASAILPRQEQEEPAEKPGFVPFVPERVEVIPKKRKAPARKTAKKTAPAPGDLPALSTDIEYPVPDEQSVPESAKKATAKRDAAALSLEFSGAAPKRDNRINSNERILELHKAGKSNMAIAKELGLGIGEVKLVIDLYKN